MGENIKKAKSRIFFNTQNVLLGMLLLVGVCLRISGTVGGYYAFTFDQGKDFLTLREMRDFHLFRLIGSSSGIDGVFHGVWWYYLLLPFFVLFAGDPTLVVGSFNLLSTGIVILAYLLGKQLYGLRMGLILAGMVAVAPFLINSGAQLWHPNVEPLLIVGFMLALWRYLEKRASFFWIGVLLGLIFEFQLLFGGLFVIAFILTLIFLRLIPKFSEFISGLLGFGFWLLPRIIFDLRHQMLQLTSFLKYIDQPTTQVQTDLTLRFFDSLITLWRLFSDAYARGKVQIGIIMSLFILWGLRSLFTDPTEKSQRKKFFLFLLVLQLLILVIAGMYPGALWSYYLIGLPVLFLPMVGLSFIKVLKWNAFVGGLIIGIWFLYLLGPAFQLGSVWEGDTSVYKNQLAVVDTVYKDAKGEKFNVSVYSPSVIDYSYHYLFLWYGNKNYGHIPDRETTQKLVYYVIEPDIWHPVLKEAWLRERRGDGTIIWQERFPGGIDVEKRIR